MREGRRICIISDQHDLYDDRCYWKQALSLKNAGYEVHRVVIDEKYENDGITEEGIYFNFIKRKKYFKNRYLNYFYKSFLPIKTEYEELLDICKNLNADLYQIVDLRPNRIIKKLKKLLPNARLIYDIHENNYGLFVDVILKKWKIPMFIKNLYGLHIQKWEFRRCIYYDYILVTDDPLLKLIKKNIKNIPITCIYNFTDLYKYRKNTILTNREFDVGYVGGISEVRGIMTILDSINYLKKVFPSIKIILLGPVLSKDFSEKISYTIKKNNLGENILIPGFVKYNEISDYYNNIKIGVIPLQEVKKYSEAIPIKLFEYMNFGLPIIASNLKNTCNYIAENNVGFCIQANNPKMLAEKISFLLNNPDLMGKFGDNGKKAVDEKYNWSIMEKKYIGIIDSLLNENIS